MYAYLALAALQVVGGFQQADIIRQNGELQARVNDLNAKYADLDAYNAISAGETNAARYDSIINSTISQDRAAYASENVAVGYGTAGEVESGNHVAGMMNTLQIQRAARDKAMGYEASAINIRLGGNMIRLQSDLNAAGAQSQGLMQGIGTMVTGYQMNTLTGRGRDKDSGTNDKIWQNKRSFTMNSTPKGDGVISPSNDEVTGPRPLGWFKDPGGNGPGFFGHGPRNSEFGAGWQPMNADGNYYFDNVHPSFTAETEA